MACVVGEVPPADLFLVFGVRVDQVRARRAVGLAQEGVVGRGVVVVTQAPE